MSTDVSWVPVTLHAVGERRTAVSRWALVVLAALASAGCLYYDSRWGQATEEQKHHAARLAPAELETSRSGNDSVRRSATVLACATPGYAAETLDWQQRFDELLRQANSVLEPDLGLSLRNAGTTLWTPPHGEADLSSVIADLPTCDGPETMWRVAFVRSTSSVVTDFHVLGRGQSYSPYLAVRATNDPAELDALSKALPDLDRETREKLYADRKRHKALTVFLHEMGHTLGGIHRSEKATIMSASYDQAERGFDGATLALLRFGVAIRLEDANRFGEARKYLEAHPEGFVPSERAATLQFLAARERGRSLGGAPRAESAANEAPPRPPPSSVTTTPFDSMPREDRQTYDEAVRTETTDPRTAWAIAQRLFEAYPTVREVQELRCRLAKERQFFSGVVEAHCARLEALAK